MCVTDTLGKLNYMGLQLASVLYLQKRGQAPFHFVYHKCSSCGSYNTRLL
jgi:Zinc-ribbon